MAELNFDPKAPIIVLQVELKGRIIETARLALDTGSTHLLIPWRIARALDVHPESPFQRIETITPNGAEFVPVVLLSSVKVMGKEATNVTAIVHDLPPKSYVDGLLGLSFLNKFKVTLDFKKGVISID